MDKGGAGAEKNNFGSATMVFTVVLTQLFVCFSSRNNGNAKQNFTLNKSLVVSSFFLEAASLQQH